MPAGMLPQVPAAAAPPSHHSPLSATYPGISSDNNNNNIAAAAIVPTPRPLTCSPRLVRQIDRLAQKGFTRSAAASTLPTRPATAMTESSTASGKAARRAANNNNITTTSNSNGAAAPSAGRARAASTRPRTTSAARSRLVVFAEHPDRLLCDPANALWVYCSYDFKFVHTDVKSRTQAERLLEQAMECAEVQYRRSVESFRRLPEAVRRGHVMRDVPLATTPTNAAAATTSVALAGHATTERKREAGMTDRSNSVSMLGKASVRSCSTVAAARAAAAAAVAGAHETSEQQHHTGYTVHPHTHAYHNNTPAAAAAAVLRSPSTDAGASHVVREARVLAGGGRSRSVTEEKARQTEQEIYTMLLRQWPSLDTMAETTYPSARHENKYSVKTEAGTRGTTTTTTTTAATAAGNTMQVPSTFLSVLRHSTLSTATSAAGTSYSFQHQAGGNSTSVPGMSNAVRHAMRSRAHMKVKLFVDIVASRKSLREVPTESKPYRLGQHLYHYVEEHYPDTVMHMCVGLSDAKVRLTCRDLLFPYRRMPVGTMITAEEDAQHTALQKDTKLTGSYNAVVSPGAMYEAHYNTGAPAPPQPQPGYAFAHEAMLRGQRTPFLSAHTRLPPVTPDMIDQRRMLICFSANTRASAQT